MNEIQVRLRDFARNQALPYLSSLPQFNYCIDKLSFVLVGSVSTGLCRPDSDVDIAIVCERELFNEISKGTHWLVGKPTEEIINGIQLHYYAVPFDLIEKKFNDLDDLFLYVYSNCMVLQDADNQFARRIGNSSSKSPEIRQARLEGKLDMLLRRSKALEYCIKTNEDILNVSELCFEIIKLSLKVTALLDNIDFEPRKRLFGTALAGETGIKIENKIRNLFYTIGLIGISRGNIKFPEELNEIVSELSKETQSQGFMVGLEKPDKRHAEV